MKRSWLITILVCLLLLGGGTVVILMPQVIPYSQCSDVYKQYADVDGIDATFIKDYKVNDTLTVNVTLLRATDSSGWATLRGDFGTHDVVERISEGKDLVSVKMVPSMQDRSQQDTCGTMYDVAAISYMRHTVSIFHTKNRDERYAVYHHNYDNNVSKTFK